MGDGWRRGRGGWGEKDVGPGIKNPLEVVPDQPAHTLGLEVGRTDIKALSIGCDTAQLVF